MKYHIGLEIDLSLCSNGSEGETQKDILNFLNYKDINETNEVSKKIKELLNKNDDILNIATSILTKIAANPLFIKKD